MDTKNVNKKTFREIPINNPFIREDKIWDKENELFDKIKTAVLTVLLFPIRVILMIVLLLVAYAMAYVAIYGYSREDLKLKPLSGWRWRIKVALAQLGLSMWMLMGVGLIVKGKQAKRSDAPILVIAPHTTFLDGIICHLSKLSSPIARQEWNLLGKLIDMAQPIYVKRENHSSRTQTIKDILERAKSPHDWPQIMIFPEGTCTNGQALIDFKPGAFFPGQSVQPVLIRYPNKIDTYTWTWQGPNVFILVWRTLSQFHTFVEIEFLPVYNPSEEEIKDPKLYASNVQQLMANALNLPVYGYAFDDCKLMDYAYKCKLFFASKIADVAKFRERIGLASSQIEEYIVKENFKGTEDYYIKFEEFVQRLKIPADDVSYTLFRMFASPSEAIAQDVIDFKEYLLHALFLIKMQEPKIELVRVLFMLYGESGRLQREPFKKILKHFLKLPSEKIDQLFYSIDSTSRGYITFDDFFKATENNRDCKRLYETNRNFKQNAQSQ